MKVTQHDTRDPDIADPDRGPGERLKRAREAAGLSTADVASRLRLDQRTIHRLEADEVEGLAAPTFVRGYFSSYARLLGLPPGPILEELERTGLEPPPLLADISRQTQARSGDFPVKMVTNLVVLVLVVLVAVWWRNQSSTPDNGADQPLAERAAPVVDDAAPAPPEPPPPTPTVTVPANPAPVATAPPVEVEVEAVAEQGPPAQAEAPERPVTDGAVVADAPAAGTADPVPVPDEAEEPTVVAEAEPGPPGDEATESEVPPETASPAEPAPETLSAEAATAEPGEEAAPAAPPAEEPAAEPLPEGQARLQVAFQEESWVEIYDKSGRRLYFNLAKPGMRLDLRGEPPFNILLGYAEGATVEYNGVFFDPMPFAQRGVARFSLGEDELNAQLASRPDGQTVGEPAPQPER